MKYLVQRTLQAIVTFVIVLNVSFVLVRFLPGGPMDFIQAQMIQESAAGGGQASAAEVARLTEIYTNLNPQDPLYVQWLDYMIALLQIDLGHSIYYQESVTSLLASALPWTVFIMATSIILIYVIGIILGALMAYVEGSRFDSSTSVLSTILTSIPYYVVGILFLYYFAYRWSLFPTGGRMSPGMSPGLRIDFFVDALYHATLPILSTVLVGIGGVALGMRGNSVSVIGSDYMRVAQLRGLSTRRIAVQYVTRNAILPMYTSFMISVGSLFGGSIILERIFVYPGVGWVMFQAISARDHVLLMGGFIIITLAVILGIFVADLTYGWIDPRAEAGGGNNETY